MTEKENFMRVVRGEKPEWLPRFVLFRNPRANYEPATLTLSPSFLTRHRAREGGFDIWGVEYQTNRETGWASISKPGVYILDDIKKWRDVIKAPDISGIDWEKMAREDIEKLKINRDETALFLGLHVGYFQNLMNFMGFVEGLCAMVEEPEEIKALFEYMSDFYCEVAKRAVEYYKPDAYMITDDTATRDRPFISPRTYRELVKPFAAREAKIAAEAGCIIAMHCCGKCEGFIDDWLDFGVQIWEPCEVTNDIPAIKRKYGDRLMLMGCWDSSGPASWPGATEEVVKKSVREAIDRGASGGGRYAFCGGVIGDLEDEEIYQKNTWIFEEYESYGRNYYKTHA